MLDEVVYLMNVKGFLPGRKIIFLLVYFDGSRGHFLSFNKLFPFVMFK